MKLLVAYDTVHGSTAEIAQFMGNVLREYHHDVTVEKVTELKSVSGYDAYLLGTPVYGGMWLTGMSQFLDLFEADLALKPVYFWLACIRVMEEDGYEHARNNYVYHPTLDKIGARDLTIFAGRLNLDGIDWNERWTLSARYDGHQLPGKLNDDFRDWKAIRAWSEKVSAELQGQQT